MRILAWYRVSTWNVWAFSNGCCGCVNQRHHEGFTVRRNVRAEVMMHWVAVAGREDIEVGAVTKRGVGVFAASIFVLPSTRFVRVVWILLAMN